MIEAAPRAQKQRKPLRQQEDKLLLINIINFVQLRAFEAKKDFSEWTLD